MSELLWAWHEAFLDVIGDRLIGTGECTVLTNDLCHCTKCQLSKMDLEDLLTEVGYRCVGKGDEWNSKE